MSRPRFIFHHAGHAERIADKYPDASPAIAEHLALTLQGEVERLTILVGMLEQRLKASEFKRGVLEGALRNLTRTRMIEKMSTPENLAVIAELNANAEANHA